MGHRYLLVTKNGKFETILSYGKTIESIMEKTKYLSFDYYLPSRFYIRDTVENKLLRLWLSKEFGCSWSEVEDDNISKNAQMHFKDGSRYMARTS